MPDNRRRHSRLTGAQIRWILEQLGVSHSKFLRDTGLSKENVRDMLNGNLDGDIPLIVEPVLLLYIVDEVAREEKGELQLPLREYGLTLDRP